jgi:hypothetical protein
MIVYTYPDRTGRNGGDGGSIPGLRDQLGIIPSFLSEDDPRPAKEQFDANYDHGGGWRPMPGFTLDRLTLELDYSGDPPMRPIALMRLRDEVILVYPYSFVLILQRDRSFEICRMD